MSRAALILPVTAAPLRKTLRRNTFRNPFRNTLRSLAQAPSAVSAFPSDLNTFYGDC
jgi:hypothetical protein